MSFNSVEFIIFFIVFLTIIKLLSGTSRLLFLLSCNLFFLSYLGNSHAIVMIYVVAVSFFSDEEFRDWVHPTHDCAKKVIKVINH